MLGMNNNFNKQDDVSSVVKKLLLSLLTFE
jgi:hypothetical protein